MKSRNSAPRGQWYWVQVLPPTYLTRIIAEVELCHVADESQRRFLLLLLLLQGLFRMQEGSALGPPAHFRSLVLELGVMRPQRCLGPLSLGSATPPADLFF